jgi:hypothetical protein
VVLYGDPVPAGSLGVDDRVPIAVVSIPGDQGTAAANALAAGGSLTVTFDAAIYAGNPSLGSVAPFSSSGPGYGGQSKPDVVLPGVGVVSAEAGGQWGSLSGTSVAAAQAAGEVATLAAVHPDWAASELRAALVSTAQQVAGIGGGIAPVEEQGGGRPDPAAAASVPVIVAPATLAFGRIDRGPATAGLTIRNPGAAPVDVTLAVQRDDTIGDVQVQATPPRFVLAPGAVFEVPVTVTLGPGGTTDPVVGGWMVVVLGDGRSVRVPFTAVAAPPGQHPLQSAALTSHSVHRSGTKTSVTLAAQVGDVALSGDTVDITPLAELIVELHGPQGTRTLYTAHDLNPGLYRYAVAPRDDHGELLPAGRYTLVVRAVSVDGVTATRSLPLRVR